MGLYMYVSEQDRISKRKVSDEAMNELFQDALLHDPSLMIEEHIFKVTKGIFKKRIEIKTTYSIYHETPAYDGSAYQARLQSSASGEANVVVAYLHGLINGAYLGIDSYKK